VLTNCREAQKKTNKKLQAPTNASRNVDAKLRITEHMEASITPD
jgi:hypothetical protein